MSRLSRRYIYSQTEASVKVTHVPGKLELVDTEDLIDELGTRFVAMMIYVVKREKAGQDLSENVYLLTEEPAKKSDMPGLGLTLSARCLTHFQNVVDGTEDEDGE